MKMERVPRDPRIISALKRMHRDSAASIEAIAGQVGLSVSRFRILFRAHVGASPVQTLRSIRLEHARRLLSETTLSIKEVAARCGVDVSHFVRDFEKAYGASPTRWRSALAAPPKAEDRIGQ